MVVQHNKDESLHTDYQQTNEQIRMLTDIRFKLLALIPTGTVVAVSVLGTAVSMETALVVGMLGFVLVFAIAMYDLRNSQIYDAYLLRAIQLEKQLQVADGGLYSNRPERNGKLFGLMIWHDRALAFVYGTTLGGWFYLIIYFFLKIFMVDQYVIFFYTSSILISALVALAFIWQFHAIEVTRSERKITIHNVQVRHIDGVSDDKSTCACITVSLKNGGVHSFTYNISTMKLRNEKSVEYSAPGILLPDRKNAKNIFTDPHFMQQLKTKVTVNARETRHGILIYKIPKQDRPTDLVYTPFPRFLHVRQVKDLLKKNILLIRHGQHENPTNLSPGQETPLTQGGRYMVHRLKDLLAHRNLTPEMYLTSTHLEAQETAAILSDNRLDVVFPLAVLASNSPKNGNIFQTITTQARQKGIKLSDITTLAIVGHEPMLGEILKCLTSECVFIDRAEAVWVRAYALPNIPVGKGVMKGQIPGEDGSGEQESQDQGEGSFSRK